MNIRLLSHHVVIFHENCVNLIYVAEKREMIRADMMRAGRIIVGQVKNKKAQQQMVAMSISTIIGIFKSV